MSNFNIKLSKNEKGEKFEEVNLEYTISKDTKAGFLNRNGLSEDESLLKELDLEIKSNYNNVVWFTKHYLLQEGNKHRNVTYCFTNNYLNKKHNGRIVLGKMDALRGKTTNHEEDARLIKSTLTFNSKPFIKMLEALYKKDSDVYVDSKVVDDYGADIEEYIDKEFFKKYKDRIPAGTEVTSSAEMDFISDDGKTEWFCKYFYFEAEFPEDNRYIIYYYTKENGKLLVISIDDENNILDEDFMDHYLIDRINLYYITE